MSFAVGHVGVARDRARRPAHPMDVLGHGRRHVVVHDAGDALDVDASSCHIGSDQDPAMRVPEIG